MKMFKKNTVKITTTVRDRNNIYIYKCKKTQDREIHLRNDCNIFSVYSK